MFRRVFFGHFDCFFFLLLSPCINALFPSHFLGTAKPTPHSQDPPLQTHSLAVQQLPTHPLLIPLKPLLHRRKTFMHNPPHPLRLKPHPSPHPSSVSRLSLPTNTSTLASLSACAWYSIYRIFLTRYLAYDFDVVDKGVRRWVVFCLWYSGCRFGFLGGMRRMYGIGGYGVCWW